MIAELVDVFAGADGVSLAEVQHGLFHLTLAYELRGPFQGTDEADSILSWFENCLKTRVVLCNDGRRGGVVS